MMISAPTGGSPIGPIAVGLTIAALATYHQQSVASTVMLIATSTRSWRNIRLVRSGADDTVTGQVEVRKLSVFAFDLERHRATDRAARSASDIGHLIFEAIREDDLGL